MDNMKIISKISQSIKRRGIKRTISHVFGLDRRSEEIDTLYFLLNQVTDIKKIEPSRNEDLRIMQLCNAVLLGIFDKLCAKHNLKYRLDSGTLFAIFSMKSNRNHGSMRLIINNRAL